MFHFPSSSGRSRHGAPVWYVRVGHGPRIRLRAAFGTEDFAREYQAALTGESLQASKKTGNGTLAWALSLYRQGSDWLKLAKATRRQRDNIFAKVMETAGSVPIASIGRKDILAGYGRRATTPAAARNFLEAMRGIMRWALKNELIKLDPTVNLTASRPKTNGFPEWTEEEISAFQARWPLGTRERVAFDVLFYTGLRRGDAAVFGRQHIKDNVARLKTEKTGEHVFIPIEPELAAILAAGPWGELAFISSASGRPMVKEAFGNWFSSACREAGIHKSAHGLRKAGATRDAERGFTESELEAKYGWRGGQMASKYTHAMNRERLAIQAVERARKDT